MRGNNKIPWVVCCKAQGKVRSPQQSSVALLKKHLLADECPSIKLCSLGTTNHRVGWPHLRWEHHAAPVLRWDVAWQLKGGSSVMWSRAGLCSQALGFCDTALCPSDAQPRSPVTISTGTCGLHRACAALSVSSRPLAMGAPRWSFFAVTSPVQAFLRNGGLCMGCSPGAERNLPCTMTADKSAPGETEQGC